MNTHHDTTVILTQQEKNWLLEQRITRMSDNQEALIYPMGAERYLSSVLSGMQKEHDYFKENIINKNILVIPGYGNSSFLFAEARAKSITVYDKDPVTIAWMKAFKKYYYYRAANDKGIHYPSIGELLSALTKWYPPLLRLPSGRFTAILRWLLYPKSLRRTYIFYMLSLVRHAVNNKITNEFEYEKNLQFYSGELKHLISDKKKRFFDTAFVPYLLGVTNGIEKPKEIVRFIKDILQLVPQGLVFVTPSQNTKEFYVAGQSYFATTDYTDITSIPELTNYVVKQDKLWFKTQGMAVFSLNKG